MEHQSAHLLWAVAFLVALIGTMVVVRNRIIRRRLLWSALFLLVAIVLHFVIVDRWNLETDPALRSIPDAFLTEEAWKIEGLLIVFALLNAIVPLAFNPWFRDQPSDRAPAIIQDTLVAAFGVVAAMAIFQNATLFTSSAIAAAILGFALQDTLGNAISGIAIQIEKPFRVGHWITVGDFEGMVTEITWRATKIRTDPGNLVVVPNSTVAKEAITNYSQPAAPSRIDIIVGAAYQTPPNEVRAAISRALADAPGILRQPAPDVLVDDFAASSINYRVRFWILDYSQNEEAGDVVRTAIYYEFRRRGIDIPYPVQVEYSKQEPPVDTPERRDRFRQALAAVPVLSPLPEEAHRALAATVTESLYANGEVIVREGDAGDSMFIVLAGEVAIVVGPDRREVAVTKAGGYFGEMSLLTGDARTATVLARGDATVLEISGAAFREYVRSDPGVIDELAAAAVARRRELDESRGRTPAPAAAATLSLAERMRRFFGIGARSGQVMK